MLSNKIFPRISNKLIFNKEINDHEHENTLDVNLKCMIEVYDYHLDFKNLIPDLLVSIVFQMAFISLPNPNSRTNFSQVTQK